MWRPAAEMHHRRRQHNATVLPDGTVLVTGGTAGPGFNDVSPGKPVHTAELWDPHTDQWTTLNAEDVDRCYHATALVLPDATVLSAGGGEFMAGPAPNAPADTHRDAQIFHPPYLFRGPRPVITTAPTELTAGGTFTIEVAGPEVAAMALLRLASATHAFDMNQRRIPVPFTATATDILTATLPAEPGVCLPGHYMLFVLSADGVPSIAKIVRIGVSSAPHALADAPQAGAPPRLLAADEPAPGTRVTVGLTSQCPYGLAACWGGAYEGLTTLTGVAVVTPYADAADSTAEVFLGNAGLPDLDAWPDQLARSANGSYVFRGVEITVDGTVERQGDDVVLVDAFRPPIRLRPLEPGQELAWDLTNRGPRAASDEERAAFSRLADRIGDNVQVTGPAGKSGPDWSLAVREVRNA
jgi:galactose oxidase